MMQHWTIGIMSIVTVLVSMTGHAEMLKHDNPLWKPIVDEVYLQEIASHINTKTPLTSVAVYKGNAYVGDATGISKVHGTELNLIPSSITNVQRLEVHLGQLWVISPEGLWRYDGSALKKKSAIKV